MKANENDQKVSSNQYDQQLVKQNESKVSHHPDATADTLHQMARARMTNLKVGKELLYKILKRKFHEW
ncbi:MAG: hypothetical protein ABI723_25815 [Bacteroidia bacterium]